MTEKTALDEVVEKIAIDLVTGPALAISKTREMDNETLINLMACLSKMAKMAGGTAEYIGLVLDERKDSQREEMIARSAFQAGQMAFERGDMRAPYMDENTQFLMESCPQKYLTLMFESWLRGWDTSNVARLKEAPPF